METGAGIGTVSGGARCCNSNTDCVAKGVCYTSGATATNSVDADKMVMLIIATLEPGRTAMTILSVPVQLLCATLTTMFAFSAFLTLTAHPVKCASTIIARRCAALALVKLVTAAVLPSAIIPLLQALVMAGLTRAAEMLTVTLKTTQSPTAGARVA